MTASSFTHSGHQIEIRKSGKRYTIHIDGKFRRYSPSLRNAEITAKCIVGEEVAK